MRLTPRKSEIAAVKEVLETPGFASADEAAKEVIKVTFDALAERTMYAFAWRHGEGDPVVSWGPFSSENEAEKFGKTLMVGGQGLIVTLFSPVAVAQTIAEAEEPRVGACTTCGHPWGTHQHERRKGICQVNRCKCQYMTK